MSTCIPLPCLPSLLPMAELRALRRYGGSSSSSSSRSRKGEGGGTGGGEAEEEAEEGGGRKMRRRRRRRRRRGRRRRRRRRRPGAAVLYFIATGTQPPWTPALLRARTAMQQTAGTAEAVVASRAALHPPSRLRMPFRRSGPKGGGSAQGLGIGPKGGRGPRVVQTQLLGV